MKNLFNIFNPDNKIANFLTKIMYLAWSISYGFSAAYQS